MLWLYMEKAKQESHNWISEKVFSGQDVFKKTNAATVTQLLLNRGICPFATLFPQTVFSKGALQ